MLQIWNECSGLFTNCILYYNAALLSSLLAQKERGGDAQGAALVQQISPEAWQHINFYGGYEFSKEPGPINLEAIVEELKRGTSGSLFLRTWLSSPWNIPFRGVKQKNKYAAMNL